MLASVTVNAIARTVINAKKETYGLVSWVLFEGRLALGLFGKGRFLLWLDGDVSVRIIRGLASKGIISWQFNGPAVVNKRLWDGSDLNGRCREVKLLVRLGAAQETNAKVGKDWSWSSNWWHPLIRGDRKNRVVVGHLVAVITCYTEQLVVGALVGAVEGRTGA